MGPFDNEKGVFLQAPGYEEGHWFVSNTTGDAFIVPKCDAEIEGPDGEVVDELNAVYREQSFDQVDPEAVAEQLGLSVVPDVLKRFDSRVGYYSV